MRSHSRCGPTGDDDDDDDDGAIDVAQTLLSRAKLKENDMAGRGEAEGCILLFV